MEKHIETNEDTSYIGTASLAGATLVSAGITAYNYITGDFPEMAASAIVTGTIGLGLYDNFRKGKIVRNIDEINQDFYVRERELNRRTVLINDRISQAEEYINDLEVKKNEVMGAIDELSDLKNTLQTAEERIERLTSYKSDLAYMEEFAITHKNGRERRLER